MKRSESYWLDVYLYHGYRSLDEKISNFLMIAKEYPFNEN